MAAAISSPHLILNNCFSCGIIPSLLNVKLPPNISTIKYGAIIPKYTIKTIQSIYSDFISTPYSSYLHDDTHAQALYDHHYHHTHANTNTLNICLPTHATKAGFYHAQSPYTKYHHLIYNNHPLRVRFIILLPIRAGLLFNPLSQKESSSSHQQYKKDYLPLSQVAPRNMFC